MPKKAIIESLSGHKKSGVEEERCDGKKTALTPSKKKLSVYNFDYETSLVRLILGS
jgi:hypothetical protein